MDNLMAAPETAPKPSGKKQIWVFLLITFGLTYSLDVVGLVLNGPITAATIGSKWGMLLGFQMLIPAASAIISLLIFRDARLTGANKWFIGYFMLFFLVSLVFLFTDYKINMPTSNPAYGPFVAVGLSQIIPAIMGMLGFILLLALNIKKSTRATLATLKLSFGHHKYYYLLFPLLYALVLVGNDLFNYVFKLNSPAANLNLATFGTMIGVGLINGITANWVFFFGEEFGWRVYLQELLIPLVGRQEGIILLGFIWGLWHAPVIAAGYNYPGHPIAGIICMVLFCISIGIFFSYAVIKTGSVWIAALLHLITNTVLPAAMFYLFAPGDVLLSFGMGIYGIMFLGILAALIFKYGKWQADPLDGLMVEKIL